MTHATLTGEIKLPLDSGTAVLKFSETPDEIRVDSITVPKDDRGRGMGRLLMSYVFDIADAKGKPIRLSARPIGQGHGSGDRLERLLRFYAGIGFEEIQRGVTAVEMVRPVGGIRP